MTKQENTLICDLSVFTESQRQQHMADAQALFAQALEVIEDDKGFKLQLPDNPNILIDLATFIQDDRQCCPFIQFGLSIEAHSKGIWLLLQGNGDVKETIRAELLGLLPQNLR